MKDRSNEMENCTGIKSGKDIVNRNAHSSGQFLRLPDGEGFPDIEKTEKEKGR